MRVNVQKILFIGPESQKNAFFSGCQKQGLVHFIEPKGFIKPEISKNLERLTDALKVLRSYKKEEVRQLENGHDPDIVAANILQARDELVTLSTKKNELLDELKRLEIYGLFEPNELEGITVRLWTTKASLHVSEKHPLLISFGSIEGVEYLASFDKEFTGAEALSPLHYTASTYELLEDFQICQEAIRALEGRIVDALQHEKRLRQALIIASNEQHRYNAKLTAAGALDNMLFYAEGWVPITKVDTATNLASEFQIWSEKMEIEAHDFPPTVLENKGLPRVGEDLIRIFDTPSSTDKDPSIWVLCFFSLFFSMIVGDGGYGLLFLLLSYYMWKKFHPKAGGVGRRFIKLCTTLGIVCVLWGLLIHSFFGINLSPDNPFRKNSFLTWLVEKKASYYLEHKGQWYQEAVKAHPDLLQAKTPQEFIYSDYSEAPNNKPIYDLFADNALFELVLFIGSLHIFLGLLRYARKNPTGIGWALFLVGGYCYIPGYLHATSMLTYAFGITPATLTYVGTNLLIFGLSTAVLIAIIKHGFTGIFECMTAVQLFADVLSYLRIYALALAGAICCNVINETVPFLPLYLVPLLLIVAHAVNILLAIVGGIIHGLRLNFLEWYHYSFEGGGKQFKPLSLEKTD